MSNAVKDYLAAMHIRARFNRWAFWPAFGLLWAVNLYLLVCILR